MTRPLLLAAFLLVAIVSIPPAVVAADCTLAATSNPGRSIDLAGTGYPADAPVAIAVVRSGVPQPVVAATTDASGSFAASIDAGPGLGGAYTFIATAGSCSATAEAVAVETAGGTPAGGGTTGGTGGAGGARETLPPTDTLVLPDDPVPSSGRPIPVPGMVPAAVLILGSLLALAYPRLRGHGREG